MRTAFAKAWLAGLTLVIAALACSPPSAPKPSGLHHDGRQCNGAGNTNWIENQFWDTLFYPPCPYTVPTASTTVTAAYELAVPAVNIEDNASVTTNIYNSAGVVVGGANPSTFQLNTSDDSSYASPTGSFTAGTGNPIRDSADFEVAFLADGSTAEGWAYLPGDISTGNPSIIGNVHVLVGTPAWAQEPDWDTAMYNFKWVLDGSVVSGATHATFAHAFTLAGTHTIKAIDIQTSGKPDTTTYTAYIAPSSSISGPTQIQNPGTYTWTATSSGCNTTCTYQWQELPEVTGGTWGNTTGTTTHSQSVQTTSPSFQLRVVTTSQGQSSTSATYEVNNLSGGSGCNPDCAKKLPPRAIQVKR